MPAHGESRSEEETMSRRRGGGLRIAAALALTAVLVAAMPLAAAGPSGSGSAASGRPVLEALWTWARIWLGLPFGETRGTGAPKAACDGGPMIDPDGCPHSNSPAGATSDAGLSIDPDG
jgi:hypothetical protein